MPGSEQPGAAGPDGTVSVAEPWQDGLRFGEAPRWHQGRLWYSDFFDHAVFSLGPDGRRTEAEVPGQPSGLGWLPDGRLLVVSMVDRVVLRREPDGTLVHHADLAPWAGFHGNDMVVAADGTAFVGNFGFDLYGFYAGTVDPVATSLVAVSPDGTASQAAPDMAFPNGMVLFPDGRTLVVAESLAGRLTAFTVTPEGTLVDRRVWAPLEACAPDGICLDAEGCVWVANALAPECLRVSEGGAVTGRVATSQPCFACMLGGQDRRTLFLMTAPTSDEREVADRRDGRIERDRVAVPGAGLP